MDSGFGPGLWFLGLSYMELGRFDEAIPTLQGAVKSLQNLPLAAATLGVALARSGSHESSEQILESLITARSKNYVSPYYLAALCLALGRKEETASWLSQAVEDRNNWLVFLEIDPLFDDYRSTSDYQSIVAQVGLDSAARAS